MSLFNIHSKKTRCERERKHKGRKNCQIFNRHICIQIKNTFHGIFHRFNIFFNNLNFRENFIKLIFQIFKIIFNLLTKSSFHMRFCQSQYGNLRFHHMFQCNDISLFDHQITNRIVRSTRK